MNIVSLYFALWVVKDCDAPDILYSLTYSSSMIMVAIFSPIFGIIADRSKNVIPLFALITIFSCGSTYLIGIYDNLLFGLFFFLIANFTYQSALVFYNFLLPEISDDKNRGKISGIGVGFGYVGAIIGLILIEPFVIKEKFNTLPAILKPVIEFLSIKPLSDGMSVRINAFIPTAILFFIFSIPCFLFVKQKIDPSNLYLKSGKRGLWKELLSTLRSFRKNKNIFLFLLSNLLFMDAVHTVIIFMSVFASNAIGFNDIEIVNLLIISTTFAILGSFMWGFISDKYGHKKTLTIILHCWLIVLISAAIVQSKALFYLIGALCGVSMGGVWVSARPLLVSITPKEKTGEFFGLYGLTGKFAAITGPMIWGLITFIFESYGNIKYRLAILALSILIIAGILILQRVKVE